MVGCDWRISILTLPARSCSLSGPLLYHSPVVFHDRRHPRYGCTNETGSINKLDFVPKRIMVGLVGVLRNGGGLGTGESHIPVTLFDSFVHRSLCFPDVDYTAFTGNPVKHAILFSRIDGVLRSHQMWPKCRIGFEDGARFRQRRRGSDTPVRRVKRHNLMCFLRVYNCTRFHCTSCLNVFTQWTYSDYLSFSMYWPGTIAIYSPEIPRNMLH